MAATPTIACIVEPRFPGGTSSAVARELAVLRDRFAVEVHGIGSRMFRDRPVAPVLERALDDLRLPLRMGAPQISADLVVVHNPSFLKFDEDLAPRIVARELVVVTHENMLRPGGLEAFDAAHCLRLIDRSSLALRKSLAPVSAYNRSTVADWLAAHPDFAGWGLLDGDWTNICDFDIEPPTERPADRRGRHSRPGFEKFPAAEVMDICFPAHAEENVILGGDSLLTGETSRPHWRIIPFRGIEIDSYFRMIDFMVYFTAATWRESFGRVLAEGVAAGKVVISDPDTASIFAGAVMPGRPEDVDGIVAGFVEAPSRYVDHVLSAQEALTAFSAHAFLARQAPLFERLSRRAA